MKHSASYLKVFLVMFELLKFTGFFVSRLITVIISLRPTKWSDGHFWVSRIDHLRIVKNVDFYFLQNHEPYFWNQIEGYMQNKEYTRDRFKTINAAWCDHSFADIKSMMLKNGNDDSTVFVLFHWIKGLKKLF